MRTTTINQLVSDALAIEAQEAKEAGALGFMCRALAQCTMPHKAVAGNEFMRRNGALSLSMLAPSSVGLPYGVIPRLLVAWVSTEAIKTQDRQLVLGSSLSEFMRALDLVPTGGRWGSITRLKAQMTKLFATSVTAVYSDSEQTAVRSFNLVTNAQLWWNPKAPDQAALWQSSLTLGEDFFNEITASPVPIDMRALRALKRSPMALDIYIWLSYRLFYLKKPTLIPWLLLQLQFGADYARLVDFKLRFVRQLQKVHILYPHVRFDVLEDGLMLHMSRPLLPQERDLSTGSRGLIG